MSALAPVSDAAALVSFPPAPVVTEPVSDASSGFLNPEPTNYRVRRNNDWNNFYVRLGTLKTINVTNLWKDVPKHGTTTQRHKQALDIWETTCDSLGVQVRKPSQWKTVATQAMKWVKEFAAYDKHEANQTGHGDNSEDEQVHDSVSSLTVLFKTMEERDEYLNLLETLAELVETNKAAAASNRNLKNEKKRNWTN